MNHSKKFTTLSIEETLLNACRAALQDKIPKVTLETQIYDAVKTSIARCTGFRDTYECESKLLLKNLISKGFSAAFIYSIALLMDEAKSSPYEIRSQDPDLDALTERPHECRKNREFALDLIYRAHNCDDRAKILNYFAHKGFVKSEIVSYSLATKVTLSAFKIIMKNAGFDTLREIANCLYHALFECNLIREDTDKTFDLFIRYLIILEINHKVILNEKHKLAHQKVWAQESSRLIGIAKKCNYTP